MSNKITPKAMMAKAASACTSARLLLEHGDADGAVNRAYYSMFDAARAALLASNAPVELNTIRTHNGLIGAFGKFLVEAGHVPKDMGRLLNQTKNIRMTADYDGGSVEPENAEMIVEHAEGFVTAIRDTFLPDNDDSPRPS